MQFYVRVLTQAMFIYPLIVLIVTIPYVILSMGQYGVYAYLWFTHLFCICSVCIV